MLAPFRDNFIIETGNYYTLIFRVVTVFVYSFVFLKIDHARVKALLVDVSEQDFCTDAASVENI